MKNINVAIFPGYNLANPGNPYLPLLYQRLKRYQIYSTEKEITSFPLSWILKNRRHFHILHFHWPALYYCSKYLPKFAYRIVTFFSKLLIAKLLGYKVVWTAHNIYPHFSEIDYTLPYLSFHYLARLLLTQITDAIIVHTYFGEKQIRKKFLRKKAIFVIPHGNYIGWYPNTIEQQEARQKLLLPQNSFVYLFFGTIREDKDLSRMLLAFEKIKQKGDLLLIVGICEDEKMVNKIEQISSNNQIHLNLHYVPEEDVQIYFNASDVVVIPFDANTVVSGVLVLALSFGKPVIVPRRSGVSEIVEEEFAILYEPDRISEFSKAMQLVKTLDICKAREGALKKAESWNLDAIARSTAEVLRNVTKIKNKV